MSFSIDSRAVRAAGLFIIAALALLALAAPAHATFPGKNGKIAFERSGDIWTMNPDGTDQVNLTNTPSVGEDFPAWSADGTKIAFTKEATNPSSLTRATTAIWVMNADGSGQREVVPAPNDPHACNGHGLILSNYLGSPAWSPDGSKLVFYNYLECISDLYGDIPGSDLYMVNPDGTGEVLFSRQGLDPRWSPDGTKIGYTFFCFGGGCTDIRWTTLDGPLPQIGYGHLAWNSGVDDDHFLDWSPDGSLMSGCGEGPQLGPPIFQACYTVHPDGTGFTNLGPKVAVGRWSPDGTKFLLSGVYTENFDGSGLTKIASGGAADWQPIPNRPPDCSNVTASPDALWPPNHKLVPVSLTGATDPDGDQVTLTITGVTQDEPTGGSPNATLGAAPDQVSLRATRDGAGDGRVYRIAFKATDGRGGECTGSATVGVPHNHGSVAAESAPPSYDSLEH